jgi:hypothetical protein
MPLSARYYRPLMLTATLSTMVIDIYAYHAHVSRKTVVLYEP